MEQNGEPRHKPTHLFVIELYELLVYFAVQKLSSLILSHLFIFALISIGLGDQCRLTYDKGGKAI